ncbi:two component, sigma54 specific, transcriptional regulator, Fis family [Longilinea arvoryzae]|uniref:Two component, sigma54 specific, transcriptional regulator, Fis family n=1 Tax=Longilinea arvoryzae TaxID=360412 RepID=A0A0S7BB73_9CHLR|nr:sigma-54 dependent transcriptional regulator [Longilinea arvoryzae]GAP14830.1 two component, sigma54 specific, transcriptional regulator, Fis family [Longilinea arvoryzae]
MGMTVLIIDDEDNARENIGLFLTAKGYAVIGAATLAEGRASLQRGDADVVLLDVQLPDGYGPNLLYETAAMPLRPPIILITAYGDIDMAVDAMKNGAHDFLTKPIQLNQLEKSIERAGEVVALRRELAHLRKSQQQKNQFIVGKSPIMHEVLTQAQKAAEKSVSVLITGDTGSGKEVLAKFIHANGPRAGKPFIAINCAAIQNTMLEAELFGFEAGAFTGAEKRKTGLMEVADGGVLFLDEIASMPVDIQAKLLRALEERAFRRVGGTAMIKIDVQIVAASNRPLATLIKEGQFREDLFYRLKVVDLHVPPLRERKIDIPELVGFFIRQYNGRQGCNVTNISPRALAALTAYDWPGNIRELSNAIERAMLFCDGETIELADLPSEVSKTAASD